MEKYNISPVGLYNILIIVISVQKQLINIYFLCIYLVADCWSVVFDPLQTRVLQHTRFPCPSLSSRACSNSCSSSQWCHPTTSSSVIPFSCLQSFSASGSFPVSQLFTSCGQSIGASGSASVLPMKSWLISLKIDWFDQVAVQGTLKNLIQPHNLKASILWCSAIFMVQLSYPYMTIEKNHICDFVDFCRQSDVCGF